MSVTDITILEKGLKALVQLDEQMTTSEQDDLCFATSGTDNDCRWYILDNGSGDRLTVFFTESGVLVKGFDHENVLNQFAADYWNNDFFVKMFAGIPENLMKLLTDDERDETTFCMWYLYDTRKWYYNELSDNDGGKSYLLGYIPETADALLEWAQEYYGQEFDPAVISKLFKN